MPKTIFITGATGFIGQVVTAKAIQSGYTVRGLSRSPTGDALLTSLGATPVRGTLQTFDVLATQASAADIVIHLAFDHDFSKPFAELTATDMAAVDALAAPLAGTDKPLVVTSGTSFVRPHPEGKETDETAPVLDGPAGLRFGAETHALAWVQRGVQVQVVRLPQYVYGRANRSGFAAKMLQMAVEAGEAVYLDVDGGEYCFSEVYVDDAAELYLLVVEGGRAGDVWNGVARTTTTYREFVGAVGERVGVPVKGISRDEALERWGPFLAGFVGLVNRASGEKARSRLGWVAKGPSLLEEVSRGSYGEVVEGLKKGV
ncbi:NAD(P)-binding protein [Aspergillus heteromorphus CBS 117.55]|uniref:NAD(P)-binding protein n=1 Tax=Aspergillus heteromorphus CBS 117.55 TaxID=1448321 RepID=A0A317VDG3_9EURO|nr:NAD(P)-binding protein [Aspergillus heteromorphus CBS 117.55]PWY70932.1 NAD(P)-binding protein [Aspergillus heteromorphus CBS 117.55]